MCDPRVFAGMLRDLRLQRLQHAWLAQRHRAVLGLVVVRRFDAERRAEFAPARARGSVIPICPIPQEGT